MQTEWKAKTGYYHLVQRSVNTLLLARKISNSIQQLEKELAANPILDEEDRKARWTELHTTNARMVHKHILKYRGFLTKVGQAASIKSGELPRPWVEELRGLQDELPVSSFKEVRATVRKDLGKPLETIFRDFGEKPIASASVAQAHIATLNSTGGKVCVKIQHKGVASMVGTDLATIELICERAAKYHPDAPDTTDLVREWRRASREEVDFKREAQNALDAAEGLKRLGIDVGCPIPIQQCCARRVLTMAFIEGFKITDVDRLPPGTDREAICLPLVDAFAALAFEVGLIHGDPHPGNVFAERLETRRYRAALLDWGIVQRMSDSERVGAARWVVAVLAQDRVLYVRALQELGFVFEQNAHPDSQAFQSFVELSMGSCGWMFRDSIPTSAQLYFLEQLHKSQDKQEKLDQAQGKMEELGGGKILNKVPGIVLFFLRGLEMLQNICGTLEVVVPFSKVVLNRALPLLLTKDCVPRRALPPPGRCHPLEMAVRNTLQALDEEGIILGAQIAILANSSASKSIQNSDADEDDLYDDAQGGGGGGEEDWLCRVTVGRNAVADGPLNEDSLMPLLDGGLVVMLSCLLIAMKEAAGQGTSVDFATEIRQFWPEFAQRDKASVTFGDLLQHKAGLVQPFPRDLTFRAFCSEQRMEQHLAGCPRAAGVGGSNNNNNNNNNPPCPVVGAFVAAILRRLTGTRCGAEALHVILEPYKLHGDISFFTQDARMAYAGRKPRDSMSMEKMYEWLEEKMESLERQEKSGDLAPWLDWWDFGAERQACVDPLLVNRTCARKGEGYSTARCLRGTATAVCKLLAKATQAAGDDLLNASRQSPCPVQARSHEEWYHSAAGFEVTQGGWHVIRFHRTSDGSEVLGHGCVDGDSNSVVLQLPECTMAILLSSVDKDDRSAGSKILRTIGEHFGLELEWPSECPASVPKKKGGVAEAATPTKPSKKRKEAQETPEKSTQKADHHKHSHAHEDVTANFGGSGDDDEKKLMQLHEQVNSLLKVMEGLKKGKKNAEAKRLLAAHRSNPDSPSFKPPTDEV